MNSQEIGQLCGGFLAQVRGVFAGIENLPLAFEELERRERALGTKDAQAAALDAAIAAKMADLANLEARVKEKMEAETRRRRTEMDAQLAALIVQVDAEERRRVAAKETADKEEQRAQTIRDHMAKVGL